MRKAIIISIILGLLVLGYIVFPKSTPTPDSSPVTPLVQVKTYPVPPEVAQVATQLGLDPAIYPRIRYILGSTGPCVGEGYWACYSAEQIWLKAVKPQYLAHEYLHYIYFSHPEIKTLLPYMHSVYNSNPAFRARMNFYKPQDIDNELFSITCTEVADYELPPALLSECAKYVPNRALLPSYY